MKQQQFLEVLDRDEAERRWLAAIDARVRRAEPVPLEHAHGRVLAADVCAAIDVPGFDRSNMDGFAVRAEDTFGASEEVPVRLRLTGESIPTGVAPAREVGRGEASPIATGGMLPRGADAVVPVEVTDLDGDRVVVRRAVVPGGAVSFAGTDVGAGETVLFAGTRLTSRETGVLAAIGAHEVAVVRRPRVAILSTGDEIVQPGAPMRAGLVYDSNGRILADAVTELGGEPWFLGAFRDDEAAVRAALDEALEDADLVLLSGGTSKGEGDLNARVVAALDPGVVVHGVALKPGKPICLAAGRAAPGPPGHHAGRAAPGPPGHHAGRAAPGPPGHHAGRAAPGPPGHQDGRAASGPPDHEDGRGKPVVILPGFPTSAIFTFHEFVAPVLRRMGGVGAGPRETLRARLAVQTSSERGRLEYLLVGLVRRDDGQLAAYPMGKGSGSVTAWSRADGFVRVPRNTEIVDVDTPVEVTLIGSGHAVADLVVVGSHCAGLDRIASALAREGFTVKVQAVGSQAGLAAAQRGECDAAPMHLLDPATGCYNQPFLGEGLRLLRGYVRMQGVATRTGETREIAALLDDASLRMVNRNRGSGTRVLIDALLAGRRPPGFAYEPRSHYAVAAAIAQKRADWGVTIEPVARSKGLRFRPLRAEHYDFAIPASRWNRPAVAALRRLLAAGSPLRVELQQMGFGPPEETT